MTAAAVISVCTVPLTRRMGRSLGIMDEPGTRKVHVVATPRTGGWAVLIAFFLTVLIGYSIAPSLQSIPWLKSEIGSGLGLLREAHKVQAKLVALFLGSFAAFCVGLADDVLG